MQDFAASVREHVKNTGTKPVQPDSTGSKSYGYQEQKNPGSAATDTGMNSNTKATSLLGNGNPKSGARAIANRFINSVVEGSV